MDNISQSQNKVSKETNVKSLFSGQSVGEPYQLLENNGITVWLDGGWGVDALLGEQTRLHEDVDIVVQQKDVPKLRELLEKQGYKNVERNDTSAWNFVLGDSKGHIIDIHSGYKLDGKDYKDVSALCERFGIDYPKEYSRLKKSRS